MREISKNRHFFAKKSPFFTGSEASPKLQPKLWPKSAETVRFDFFQHQCFVCLFSYIPRMTYFFPIVIFITTFNDIWWYPFGAKINEFIEGISTASNLSKEERDTRLTELADTLANAILGKKMASIKFSYYLRNILYLVSDAGVIFWILAEDWNIQQHVPLMDKVITYFTRTPEKTFELRLTCEYSNCLRQTTIWCDVYINYMLMVVILFMTILHTISFMWNSTFGMRLLYFFLFRRLTLNQFSIDLKKHRRRIIKYYRSDEIFVLLMICRNTDTYLFRAFFREYVIKEQMISHLREK